jgi:transcriptional regulator with XRE-family HTH domain
MCEKVNLLNIFSKNMKARRKKLELTQGELATKVGISSSFITEIEIGRKSPSFTNISKIADALDAPAWSLFVEHGDKISNKSNSYEQLSITLKEAVSKKIDDVLSNYQ